MSLHHGLDQINAPDSPNFSVGGILWRSFWLTVWSFFPFLGFALAIGIPVALVVWGVAQVTDLQGHLEIVDGHLVSTFTETLNFLVVVFVSLLLFLMIQAAAVYRTFRALGGYRATFGDCLARSLGVMLHLAEFALVASILLGAVAWLIYSETSWLQGQGQIGVAVFFGVLLLFVFIFIITGCWVVFPAIVVERMGPVAAILRSWHLTRGRRWHILALVAVFAVVEFGISFLFHLEIQISFVGPVSGVVLNVPLSFLAVVVLTTSYYNLVGEKEGVRALGRIFV